MAPSCCTFNALATVVASAVVLTLGARQWAALSPVAPARAFVLPPLHALSPNTALARMQHVGAGDLVGPESMALAPDGRSLFAGLVDGRIVRITPSPTARDGVDVATIVRTGTEVDGCGDLDHQPVCGRPLGLRVTTRSVVQPESGGNGDEMVLIVADGYKGGVLMVSGIDAGAPAVGKLVSQDEDGNALTLVNDVVIAPDGTLYFTETSREFSVNRIFHAAFSGRPTGRLLSFTPASGQVATLQRDIFMPNGLELSHDGHSVLFVGGGVSVLRHNIATGELDTFIPVLPGTGDNIRKIGLTLGGGREGAYYSLGLGSKYAKPFSLFAFLQDKPWLREFVTSLVPYETLVNLVPRYGLVAIADETGAIVEVLQDPSGRSAWLSEVAVLGDDAYFGSFQNPYLGRMSLAELQVAARGGDASSGGSEL